MMCKMRGVFVVIWYLDFALGICSHLMYIFLVFSVYWMYVFMCVLYVLFVYCFCIVFV